LALAVAGCSSTDEPEHVVSYDHDYHEEFAVQVVADTVQLLVGANYGLPSNVDTTTVFIDTAVSEPGILGLDLRVLGFSYAPDDRAITGYSWRGDTLRVWCGTTAPAYRGPVGGAEKTSYPPPWFVAQRVDVRLPEGTAIKYLGRWFE